MGYKEERLIMWTELSDNHGFSSHVLMMYEIGLQGDNVTMTIKNGNSIIYVELNDIDSITEQDDIYVIRTKQRVHIHLGKLTPEISIHIL